MGTEVLLLAARQPEEGLGRPLHLLRTPQPFLRAADFGKQYHATSYLQEFLGIGTSAANKFVAKVYMWLCWRPMPKLVGGPSWPAVADVAYGYPAELAEEYDSKLLYACIKCKGNPRDNVLWDASGFGMGVDETSPGQ